MTLDDRIEQAASAFESVETARWRVYELVASIITESPPRSAARRERVELLADRLGRGKRVLQLWVRAVETVPVDLRYPYLPIATCLWAAEHLTAEEAAHWLTRAHDEGLSLRQLQEAVGQGEQVNPQDVTLRKLFRIAARSLPAEVGDRPLSPAEVEHWQEQIDQLLIGGVGSGNRGHHSAGQDEGH